MNVKHELKDTKSEPSSTKQALILLIWVIFSIITVSLIVKLFELYVNNYGLDSFFYLLIFLLSLGLILVLFPKVLRLVSQNQRMPKVKFYAYDIKKGCMVEWRDETSLDLKLIMNKMNLKIDKELEKEDKLQWIKEERKLFNV